MYLAIFLESKSQDIEAKKAAHTALAQMVDEMRADLGDVEVIRAVQLDQSRKYKSMIKWLSNYKSIPLSSFGSDVDAIFNSNRTLYPRSSAWTTMVAAGQLAELDASVLVTRLGNFYESVNVRVVDNGNDYDESVNDIGRNSFTKIWDGNKQQLMTTDQREINAFRNQLRWLHLA